MRDAQVCEAPAGETEAGDVVSAWRRWRIRRAEALDRKIGTTVDGYGSFGIGVKDLEDIA